MKNIKEEIYAHNTHILISVWIVYRMMWTMHKTMNSGQIVPKFWYLLSPEKTKIIIFGKFLMTRFIDAPSLGAFSAVWPIASQTTRTCVVFLFNRYLYIVYTAEGARDLILIYIYLYYIQIDKEKEMEREKYAHIPNTHIRLGPLLLPPSPT